MPSFSEIDRPDSVATYAEVAARGQTIRDMLARHNICLRRGSALGVLLRQADALAKAWATGEDCAQTGIGGVLSAAHVNRIAEAILVVGDVKELAEALQRIARSDMDLSGRRQSQGKDALWELDLLALLRRHKVTANLVDPPDIVCQFDFGEYAIACKKIYSEKGVDNQMRVGARQLRPFGGAGLVAFNIDDLVPERVILKSLNHGDASNFLAKANHDFVERHRWNFQQYVLNGACDGVLVSTTVIADIAQSRPQFNTHTQTTLWSVESVGPAARVRMADLRRALDSN